MSARRTLLAMAVLVSIAMSRTVLASCCDQSGCHDDFCYRDTCLDSFCCGDFDVGQTCTAQQYGACIFRNRNEGAGCNDGDGCTINDHCHSGACVGGGSKNCDDGNSCTVDGCSSGSCTHQNKSNGAGCDDGIPCTSGTVCSGGVCGGGTRNDSLCDDGNQCTTDVCTGSGCSHACPIANCTGCALGTCVDTGFGCGCAATKLCPANQWASFSNTAYGVTLYISIKPSNQALVNDTITGAPERFRVIDLGASGRVALQSQQTGALLKCPSNGMVCSADTNPYVDIGWSFELQQTGGNNLQLLSEFNSFIGLAPAFPVPALAIGFVTGDAKAQFTYVCQ